MKRTQARVILMVPALAFGLSIAAAAPSAAVENHSGRRCTNATLKGTFGFYRTGSIDFGVGGLAAVGILSFDGNGNATVDQSISRNGDYNFDSAGPFAYSLASDCTGLFLDGDGNEFSRMVVTDDGHGIYMFSESEGNAVYGVGTRIHGD